MNKNPLAKKNPMVKKIQEQGHSRISATRIAGAIKKNKKKLHK